jgi:hypothetical protein
MNKLYVDMDGVLCDFDGQCRRQFEGSEEEDLQPKETISEWKTRIGSNQFWKRIRETEGFWSTMEPNEPEIVQVWTRMSSMYPHIAILSSPDERDPACIPGKEAWVREHLGPSVLRIYESEKYKYACPKSVLVDDFTKQTEPWEKMGGKAVLFTAFDDPFWERLEALKIH